MIQIDSSSLIIYNGGVYGFTIREKYCPYAPSFHPCDFCALQQYCQREDPHLCTLFGASPEEFYVLCGVIKVETDTGQIHIFPLSGFQFI
jgi:hypothetical protein